MKKLLVLALMAMLCFGCAAVQKSPKQVAQDNAEKVLSPLKGKHVSSLLTNMSVVDPGLGLKYTWVFDNRTSNGKGGKQYHFIFIYRQSYGELHDMDVTVDTNAKGIIENVLVKKNY